MGGKAVRDNHKGAQQSSSQDNAGQEVDFHEAAIITESGEEIAITEEMVRKAIHQLDDEAYPDAEEE